MAHDFAHNLGSLAVVQIVGQHHKIKGRLRQALTGSDNGRNNCDNMRGQETLNSYLGEALMIFYPKNVHSEYRAL